MTDVTLLPRDRKPPNGAADEHAGYKNGGAEARPRILLVDDDEAVHEMLKLVLGDEGYEVVSAQHGGEAINRIREDGPPDLIILDLMMPVMSGWAVWDELQTRPELRDVPVIVFTATGLRQGAVGHAIVLSKTADVDVLLGTIDRLLTG